MSVLAAALYILGICAVIGVGVLVSYFVFQNGGLLETAEPLTDETPPETEEQNAFDNVSLQVTGRTFVVPVLPGTKSRSAKLRRTFDTDHGSVIHEQQTKLKRNSLVKYLRGYLYAEVSGSQVLPTPRVAAAASWQQPFGYPGVAIQASLDTDTFAMTMQGVPSFKTFRSHGLSDDGLQYSLIRVTVTDASVTPNVTYTGEITNHKIKFEDTTLPSITMVPTLTGTTTQSATIQFSRSLLSSVATTVDDAGADIRVNVYSGSTQNDALAATTEEASLLVNNSDLHSGNASTISVSLPIAAGALLDGAQKWVMLRLLVGDDQVVVAESQAKQLTSANANDYTDESTVFFDLTPREASAAITYAGGAAAFVFTIPDVSAVATGANQLEQIDNLAVTVTLRNTDGTGTYSRTKVARSDDAGHPAAGRGGISDVVSDSELSVSFHADYSNNFTALSGETSEQFVLEIDVTDEAGGNTLLSGVSSAFDMTTATSLTFPVTARLAGNFTSKVAVFANQSSGATALDGTTVTLLDTSYSATAHTGTTSGGVIEFSTVAGSYAIKVENGTDAALTVPIPVHHGEVTHVRVTQVDTTSSSLVPVYVANSDGIAANSATLVTSTDPVVSGSVDAIGFSILEASREAQTVTASDGAASGGGPTQTAVTSSFTPNSAFTALQSLTTQPPTPLASGYLAILHSFGYQGGDRYVIETSGISENAAVTLVSVAADTYSSSIALHNPGAADARFHDSETYLVAESTIDTDPLVVYPSGSSFVWKRLATLPTSDGYLQPRSAWTNGSLVYDALTTTSALEVVYRVEESGTPYYFSMSGSNLVSSGSDTQSNSDMLILFA